MIKPNTVIKYIIDNEPVSYTSLEYRAVKKHKMTLQQFDKLMSQVAKHYQITASIKDGDVWYKKKKSRPKAISQAEKMRDFWKQNPYPYTDLGVSPFKVCYCHMMLEEDAEFKHRPDCDAVLYPEEYEAQNPIRYGKYT
jgi:hypothetical protein